MGVGYFFSVPDSFLVWESKHERCVMLIKRVSPVTGKTNKRNVPITSQQLVDWYDRKITLISIKALSEADREFLRSGMVDECWNELAAIQKDGVA